MIILGLMGDFLDIFLHLDEELVRIVEEYDTLTYVILFAIIFLETGFIVTPFLPGDSLLFAAGALSAISPVLDIWVIIPLLFCAALLGDNVNYFVGKLLGKRVYDWDSKLIKRAYIDKTNAFYDKHGGKTIIMARFVPIVRTFAPFVAGVGEMPYKKYIGYCLAGAFLWVFGISLVGYFFGQIPIIKNNFEIVVLGIIGISVLPIIIGFLKNKLKK